MEINNSNKKALFAAGAIIIAIIFIIILIPKKSAAPVVPPTDQPVVAEVSAAPVRKSDSHTKKAPAPAVVVPNTSPSPTTESAPVSKELSPSFLQDLVKKGADTIYKYSYQDKTYYMVIDNEIVNVGGKKQVYNAAGVNVTSCDATTIPNTIVPPLCASAFSRDGLIYERK